MELGRFARSLFLGRCRALKQDRSSTWPALENRRGPASEAKETGPGLERRPRHLTDSQAAGHHPNSDDHNWPITRLSLAASITAAITRVKPLISRIRSAYIANDPEGRITTSYADDRCYSLSIRFGCIRRRKRFSEAVATQLLLLAFAIL